MDTGRRTFLAGVAAGGAACLGPTLPPAFGQAPRDPAAASQPFPLQVAIGAELRAQKPETYDPAYVRIPYPMGDVADDRGVCADTVIRAFRHAGVDLQQAVHEDMVAHFSAYPKTWGLTRADSNIDHRRVPNLETLFMRRGAALPVSARAADYLPGDIVSWRLTGVSLPHIGVVTRQSEAGEPKVAHNIGAGTQIEKVLFNWKIAGWFRFERWA
jgi:uncharacterized protein YijF (DUF1287 family)